MSGCDRKHYDRFFTRLWSARYVVHSSQHEITQEIQNNQTQHSSYVSINYIWEGNPIKEIYRRQESQKPYLGGPQVPCEKDL